MYDWNRLEVIYTDFQAYTINPLPYPPCFLLLLCQLDADAQDDPEIHTVKMANPTPIYPSALNYTLCYMKKTSIM